jgi:CYTH domain-containing protein
VGQEIERKFLVAGDGWRAGAEGVLIRQGYLVTAPALSVRVRICGERGFLTVKGGEGTLVRQEFEYEIPVADAGAMLDGLCQKPLIEKTRHAVRHAGHTWEIDVFSGENAGLVLAEVELAAVDERLELPPWVGREVTDDPRYLNANLAREPFRTWGSA